MCLAARQFPNKPCIDRTEDELTLFRALLRSLNVIENPADLCCRKIRIDQKTGLFLHSFRQSLLFQILGNRGGLTRLPDNRIAERTP